jgi:hypothetical protein
LHDFLHRFNFPVNRIQNYRPDNYTSDMESLIIKPKNKKDLKIIAALARHLNAEVYSEESPYDPAFVKKILESKEQANQEKVATIKTEDLWK